MRIRASLHVAALLTGTSTASWCQSLPPADCAPPPPPDNTLAAIINYPTSSPSACVRNDISIQLLINSNVISNVVAGGFGIGPTTVTPAGVTGLTSEEGAARLAGGGPVTILPTADESVSSPSWNVWIDGKYTWNDHSASASDLDGPLWNGMAGMDYRLTDRLTVGVIGTYENSDLDGPFASVDFEGWGLGPYVGFLLTDNIVFSGSVIGSLVDTEETVFTFDSERVQATGAVNGYFYSGTWRFTPGISVSWSKEWMEENNGLVGDRVLETGLLTPSAQVGNTLALSDSATVEPWLGAAIDWNFVNSVKQSGIPTDDDPSVDLRLQAGLNFTLGPRAQFSLTGETSGLLLGDIDTYAGEANLAIQF